MTIPSYAIPLYWLIQLTSVISLATLTPGYALKASGKGTQPGAGPGTAPIWGCVKSRSPLAIVY